MVKFMILFFKPGDPSRFEERYNNFLALVERMPSVQRRQVVHVLASPLGETPINRILEVYFEDYPTLEESLKSPAGQEAGKELNLLPREEFNMLFAEVYEEAGGRTEV
ncbi:MAG: EthD family reductase [Anaerolineae bacterium]